ncbi:MAG: cell division protein FtsB [Legionellales bacterium]|nr:cell division protein FtsB [Legionellales bacterium]
MRIIVIVLIALLVALQYKLWFGEGNVREVWQLKEQVQQQMQANRALEDYNVTLEAEIDDLKKGHTAIEEHARSQLGLVKPDETFYQVVHPE